MAAKSESVRKEGGLSPEQSKRILGENLSFAAAEAYKLLRTNLNFSLSDKDTSGKIFGMTSALQGDGKSTASINIAYTMAQSGGKVLLIEADLRLPTLSKRIAVKSAPGLSNLLAGQCRGNEALQSSRMLPNLYVMTSGDIPPNPAELLGSSRMEATLKSLSEIFDVIIVDLPPVTIVPDGVIISKMVDGMVIVVRQNSSTKSALNETIRQLQFVDAKILGFVVTGADTLKKGYKYYGSYGNAK